MVSRGNEICFISFSSLFFLDIMALTNDLNAIRIEMNGQWHSRDYKR